MAITDISIHEDNKVGDSDLLAVHSPLAFLIDVTFTGAIPDVLFCDVYDEDAVLLATFKCIPYQDLLPTERRFIFIADSILRGYMNEFDDFVQTENSFVAVSDITKIFELKFRDPDAGVPDAEVTFTAIQASKEFGENPNLTDIFNNETQIYLAPKDGVVYIYFYNDDPTAAVSINGELLQLNPKILNIISGGSTEVIIVTSNGDWLATEGEAWISLIDPSGSGDGSFSVVVDNNGTGLIRSGTVTVTQGDLIKTVEVNQAAIVSLDVTYDFDLTITEDIDTAIRYIAWRLVDILPLSRTGANINVNIDYFLDLKSDGFGNVIFYYGIGSDSVTEPSVWIVIDTAITGPGGGTDTKESTAIIEVADGEFLFVKMDLRITASIHDDATINLGLVDGSMILPAQGTVTASGDPLVWNKNINGGA